MRTRCAAKAPRSRANTYIFGNGAVQLEQLADEEAARGRVVEYYNIGTLFPDPRPERMPYFIDPPHLTDKGMDVIGKFYAEKILAADRERPVAATVSAPAVLRRSSLPLLRRPLRQTRNSTNGIIWWA